MRTVAMAMVIVGLCLSAAGGIRYGSTQQAARLALAEGTEAAPPGPSVRMGEWFAEGGTLWIAGLVVLVAGGLLGRREQARAYAAGETGDGSTDVAGTLDAMASAIDALEAALAGAADDADLPEARAELDRLRDEVVEPLVEGRGALMARDGIGRFASYFGPFSAAERNLARAWSALTDGHVPTARQALVAARAAVGQARAAL